MLARTRLLFLAAFAVIVGLIITFTDWSQDLPGVPLQSSELYSRSSARLVAYHNDERRIQALPPLEVSPLLTEAAQGHAEWMAGSGKLTHKGTDELSFVDRVIRCGYNLKCGGENIAAGSNDPKQVMGLWLNSDGHLTNILDYRFRHIGIGVAAAADGVNYWCVVFGTASGEFDANDIHRPVFLPGVPRYVE